MTTQTTTSLHTPITLESIAQRKAVLRQDIQLQKEHITLLTKELFEPTAPATTSNGKLMQAFHTGMAAFDGLMLGIKVMRRVKKLFK